MCGSFMRVVVTKLVFVYKSYIVLSTLAEHRVSVLQDLKCIIEKINAQDYVSHVANRVIGKEQLDVQQTARPIRNVLRGTLKERLEGSGLHGLRRD
ncbi:hypothetical protein DPMN_070033 [Dreissena polymorpha]|uniref:Uncharacterized protein n=1 Tax=Dreissena polymorpha TaxID=45954 RepID=A0A9D3Z598_DREPO|nr:hypothetical protein DPMN_070033 [Dreissena polymorpha]